MKPAAPEASESSPLLVAEPAPLWKPLTREELDAVAGGPGWRTVRRSFLALFWLTWLVMLGASVAIIVTSPRPAAKPLKWWQKSVFYRLRPAEFRERHSALAEQLSDLQSLGIGAVILEGLFDNDSPPLFPAVADEMLGSWAQVQHVLSVSNKTGLRVVLDVCEVERFGILELPSQYTLRFWLARGVSGVVLCDTDSAFSEKTLLEWKAVFREYSVPEEDRIVLVKQTRDTLPPLNSGSTNVPLVDVAMRSILPQSHDRLSAQEVTAAIATRLETIEEKIWPSWTVGGRAPYDLRKLLLLLTMTLPGSPTFQHDEDVCQTQPPHEAQRSHPSHPHTDEEQMRRSSASLFRSLSQLRAREEALLYGSVTFLPFNTSSNSSLSSGPSLPVLAFLRSWGCVCFLVLLNPGSEQHVLDPVWASRIPAAGLFVSTTGTDRLDSTPRNPLELRPHEAVLVRLLEAGSFL